MLAAMLRVQSAPNSAHKHSVFNDTRMTEPKICVHANSNILTFKLS
jgi:hypothetical protein